MCGRGTSRRSRLFARARLESRRPFKTIKGTPTCGVVRTAGSEYAVHMPFTVYLSSTLKDFEAERRAVQNALGDQCVVRHSYRASEDALVESCLNDVAACDLYIGILGLRYGHVPDKPFRNPKKLSITELEYRDAGDQGLPRHVFLKDESTIAYTLTDAKTKEHLPERIDTFRSQVSTDQRAAVFSDVPQLREHVLKAFSAFK